MNTITHTESMPTNWPVEVVVNHRAASLRPAIASRGVYTS